MLSETKKELQKFILLVIAFLVIYFLPFNSSIVGEAILSGFIMLGSYAREHVLLCLVPAFFIAGTISVFIKSDLILKLLGPKAKKYIAYPVAATSGSVLAVCSCTILPLFGLTGEVLGWELSLIRIVATVTSAIFIGLIMQGIFKEKGHGGFMFSENDPEINSSKVAVFLGLQFIFLITGALHINPIIKFAIMFISFFATLFLALSFKKEYTRSWIRETWDFTKKILPFLFIGVFAAGVISKALPEEIVNALLGGNRIFSNFFASVFGALMYFATLTEVPIIQSLMSLGMGKGPALALFMAGYTLSLPNMIVLTKLLGKKKAFTYFTLVISFATMWGYIYGNLS